MSGPRCHIAWSMERGCISSEILNKIWQCFTHKEVAAHTILYSNCLTPSLASLSPQLMPSPFWVGSMRLFSLRLALSWVFLFIGEILGYSVTVFGINMVPVTVSTTSGGTRQFVVDSLMCCSNYSYQVAARTSAGEGVPSEALRFMTNAAGKSDYKNFG